MKLRTESSLFWVGHPKHAAHLAVLLLACGIAPAEQLPRPCPEEFTKPRLETIHDKALWEADPVRVRSAIQELGERRCVNVMKDLIGILTFRFPFPKDIHEPGAGLQPIFTGTRYPATDALFLIGVPALPALVKVIETNDVTSLLSKNARFTVRAIFREDPAEADQFFRDAAEKAPTPEARRRLLKALETAKEDFHSD